MRRDTLRRRVERLKALRTRREPETLAERITRLVQLKHREDRDHVGLPDAFDWHSMHQRVRRMILERGDDPDRPVL